MPYSSTIVVSTKYFAALREIVGTESEEIAIPTDSTVKDFITHLSEKYGRKFSSYVFGENGNLRRSLAVVVNLEKVNHKSLGSTILREGDAVVILPPISGGKIP